MLQNLNSTDYGLHHNTEWLFILFGNGVLVVGVGSDENSREIGHCHQPHCDTLRAHKPLFRNWRMRNTKTLIPHRWGLELRLKSHEIFSQLLFILHSTLRLRNSIYHTGVLSGGEGGKPFIERETWEKMFENHSLKNDYLGFLGAKVHNASSTSDNLQMFLIFVCLTSECYN